MSYKEIFESTKLEILTKKYGESGSKFPSIREFCDIKDISFKTAFKIYKLLEEDNSLYLLNKIWCICNGICKKDTYLFNHLNKNKIIGIHVKQINNTYIAELLSLITKFLNELGIEVIISTSEENADDEIKILKNFIRLGCIGVINFPNTKILSNFYNKYPLPLLFMGREIKGANCPSVQTDNYNAGRLVANHLFNCNYKKFVFLNAGNFQDFLNNRYMGFFNQLKNLGVNEKSIFKFDVSNEETKTNYIPYKIKSIFKIYKEPIGVFCMNDLIATDLIKQFDGNSISIPYDIGIVGYDNLPIGRLSSPSLTTISYNFLDLAKNSVSMVLDLIKQRENIDRCFMINSFLNIRNSTIQLD